MVMYLGEQKISPIIKVGEINNQDKTITENGIYTADAGYTGLGEVTVNVSGGSSTTGFLVQVIDYDGTVLKSERLDEGDTFTLPSQPSHTGLIFQSWSSPVTITNNTVTVTNSDITIGATYTTASGLSEFDITLTSATGLSVTLNMDGTKDWGDGTTDTSTAHTYSSVGDYTITCDGNTMTTSSSGGLFGQTSGLYANYYVRDVRLGSNVTSISNSAFQICLSLTSIVIPSSVTSIGERAFYSCFSLTSITIPEGVTSIDNYAFSSCYSLTNIVIPSSVTSIGAFAFQECISITNITIPSSAISVSNYAFSSCYSLTNIVIPSSVTNISNNAFYDCHSLTNITILGSVTNIDYYTFGFCFSITDIVIPSSVTSIGERAFYSCFSLTSITIPEGVTSIGSQAFYHCSSILEYDFSNHTAVPTLSNISAFNGINQICKIKVPASLESKWKTATNWSTYADYIVGV